MEDGERVSFANGGRSNTAEEAICPTWLPFNLFSKCPDRGQQFSLCPQPHLHRFKDEKGEYILGAVILQFETEFENAHRADKSHPWFRVCIDETSQQFGRNR